MTWLLGLALLALAWLLLRAARQRRQLQRWLENPDEREIPEGKGTWREVFSALQRRRKEEIRARAEVDALLGRFRLAVQALPDGVILLDAAGHIQWLNEAAGRHFGLDPARDAGTLVGQLVRQAELHDQFVRFRAGDGDDPVILHMSGERPAVLSVLLRAFAGTGIVLLSRDITEIARTEVIRRDFIANVSHELRTPLTVISGFLEQLSDEPPPPPDAARVFLGLMAEQSGRMNRLVEDLLTLSRLENDTEPPREEEVDVPGLLESLRSEASALSGGKHVIELGEVAACPVCASADELRSAFGNLVSNAVRYTPEGGRIALSWRIEDGCPVFSVADSGIGIPPEHIPRLTERFYRVDKGRSTATGGTGLGLAIVKHVLARHQGTLTIRSEVGRGSVFSAHLPIKRIAAQQPC
jgi:two-component system phosphate regulon sensor histidine kinase PhoR